MSEAPEFDIHKEDQEQEKQLPWPVRIIMHIPMGIVTVWPCGAHGDVYALIAFGSFAFYEKNEDRYLRDGAWIDMAGYIIGVVAACLWFKLE